MKNGTHVASIVFMTAVYVSTGIIMMLLTGCVSTGGKEPQPPPPPPPPQISALENQNLTNYSSFLEQGTELERQKEHIKALQRYKAALVFKPNDDVLSVKIAALERQLQEKASDHFKKGVDFFKLGKTKDARREFLLTLASDPANIEAIDYLKNKMNDQGFSSYTVKEEKSPQEIAKKTYGDFKFAFLVVYFNGLETDSKLRTGQVLSLPMIDNKLLQQMTKETLTVEGKEPGGKTTATTADVKALASKAMAFLGQWQYEKAREIVDSILEVDKKNQDARDIIILLEDEADSYQQMAKVHFEENNLEQSLQELQVTLACTPDRLGIKNDIQQIDHLLKARYSFKDGRYAYAKEQVEMSLKSELTRQFSLELVEAMNSRAEEHYQSGAEYFTNKNYDLAAKEWRKSLTLNSAHKQAKEMLAKAEQLLK